jgi:hypothetical protein
MPRFYLIDQSLKGIGGHHFTYARDLLAAANEANYEVVLATHRRFRRCASYPKQWRIIRAFRHSAYGEAKELALFPCPQQTGAKGVARGHRGSVSAASVRRLHGSFRNALRSVLQSVPPHGGDIAFLPTCSVFDVASLTRALVAIPESDILSWHVQFHSDFLGGSCRKQVAYRRQRIAEWLRASLTMVPHHALHFYATTDLLTQSYNDLNIVPFRTLPHIAVGDTETARAGSISSPLRVACLGGSRVEKGLRHLQAIIDATSEDLLSSGRIQFIVQSKPRNLWRHRPRLAVRVGSQPASKATYTSLPSDNHVVILRHPLPQAEYRHLLVNSDIGLFLYDRDSYQNRCSGVLTELLVLGKVVIVPGGSGLSSQIDVTNYNYRQAVASGLTAISEARLEMVSEQLVQQNDARNGGWPPDSSWVRIPPHSTFAAVKFPKAIIGCEPAKFIVRQIDTIGRTIHRQQYFESSTQTAIRPQEFVRVDSDAAWLQCSYDVDPTKRRLRGETEVTFFGKQTSTSNPPPTGVQGLSFADYEAIPDILREVVTHFEHYQQCARRLARRWKQLHHPSAAFQQLTEMKESCDKAA